MSRFADFIRGITSPFVDDGDGTLTQREKRHRARSRRRRRFNSPDVSEKKSKGEEIDRRINVNDDVRDSIRGNAKTKPYDAVFLRDLSANAIVQAYIDTLAQDVAGANWSIKPRDEDADIDDETLAKIERHLRELPPAQASFRDLLESTTRVLLELGDSALIKHYYKESDRVAELVPVDSASIFKKVDKHGITNGYVQVSLNSGNKKDEFAVDDIVWIEWSSRPDRHYGQGPLEKAQNEVELIEELAEKERLDLIQGGPPGVLSPEAIDEYGGLPDDEDWDTFVENMRLDQGERHRVGYSKNPVNFEPINHNYQELQILDRSKYWVTVLGSVFKVNPSYAGFDFENVNRATDESQQDAYQQRGFRVTLRQVEESLNRGLIWDEISKDVRFEFEREQTVDDRKTRAELIESQASAGKEMANAGRDVSFRDGRLVVEDGEIDEGDVGGGGGGGGLFGSVERSDKGAIPTERFKSVDGVRTFRIEAPDDSRFTDPTLAWGIEFPNSGVYVDWNIDAWPDGEELSGPHVSDYATIEDLIQVTEGTIVFENGDKSSKAHDDGVRLIGPNARPAYDSLTHWEDWLTDVANAGGRIVDHSGFDAKQWPPNKPDAVNARMVVYGLSETDILGLLDRYPLDLQVDTDRHAEAKDDAGGSGNGNDADRLSKEQVAKLDTVLLRAFDRQITPATLADIEKRSWEDDEDVPDYVLDKIRDVVDRGAVFSDFDSVPGRVADTITDVLSDALTQRQGWSLDSIVDRLSDALPRADSDDLETIARTESAKVLNEAREDGYRDRGLDDALFRWVGPQDSRTTQACEDLKIATGVESGTAEAFSDPPGEPVTLPELIDLQRQAHDYHFPNLRFRKHTVHINERHSFVRAPESGVDDFDVDVPSAEDFGDRFESGDLNVEPVEQSAKSCDTDTDYGDVVTRVAKATNPTRRMRELENTLGNHVPNILRECLEASDGSKRGALREFNRRLEEADEYDVEERGKVSPNTLYDWIDVYATHVDHLA